LKRNLLASIGFVVWVLLTPVPGFAHHGSAAYDLTKVTTVKGTVTDFEFINPHVEIYFEVKDEKGNVEKWDGEAANTLALHRHGWTSKSLKPGDVVTFIGNRAKNGTNVLRLRKVVLPDGAELDPFPGNE
jgi:Family of unknown function (DUF6152)